MTIGFTALFTAMGKIWGGSNTQNTAIGTTMFAKWETAMQAFGAEGFLVESARDTIRQGQADMEAASILALAKCSRTPTETVIIEGAHADNPLTDKDLTSALKEWIDQMIATSQTLEECVITLTPTYGASNTGNGVIVSSDKRGDGLVNELALSEDITLECIAVAADGTATFSFAGEESVDEMDSNWPAGSDSAGQLTSMVAEPTAVGNLITNGSFEDSDANNAHMATGWVSTVGVLGTDIKLTPVEVQTIAISGTPTGGNYTLKCPTPDGKIQTTDPLAYNAPSTAVSTALKKITGWADVTVVESGSDPDYTHTVTLTKVKTTTEMTSIDNLTGGTPAITHATTTSASANVARLARSLEFVGDASTLSDYQQRVTLAPKTAYEFSVLVKRDVNPAVGTLTVDLVDSLGGTVIADDESTNNTFAIDLTAMTTSFVAKTVSFRTPSALPDTVYLRIRLTAALSIGTIVWLDEVILTASIQLYSGGPFAAVITGDTGWAIGDTINLAVSNDDGGSIHRKLDANCLLRPKGLLFPTTTAPATVPDSLIN